VIYFVHKLHRCLGRGDGSAYPTSAWVCLLASLTSPGTRPPRADCCGAACAGCGMAIAAWNAKQIKQEQA
jgi:hypothetical protein